MNAGVPLSLPSLTVFVSVSWILNYPSFYSNAYKITSRLDILHFWWSVQKSEMYFNI